MNRQQLATERALRILPSHGWTAGWIGRRDRALIVLSQLADLPFERIARLAAGDISFGDDGATIAGTGPATTIASTSDGLLCAPCALARWMHALDLTVVYTDTNVIASVIGRSAPLTAQSPHVCQNPQPISIGTRDVPVLPAIDRWGILAPQPLSPRPHPRSHLTRATGPIAVHHPAASPTKAPGDVAPHRAGHGPVAARRRDAGPGTTEAAGGLDVAELRAGELEKRLHQILEHAAILEN